MLICFFSNGILFGFPSSAFRLHEKQINTHKEERKKEKKQKTM